jgi:hypothetical protein
MGKAAERRTARRRQFLTEMAQMDPKRFRREWAKRIESWADEIWASSKSGMIDIPPVFSIVDKAKKVLSSCGEMARKLQLKETTDVLNNECCRALAPHIGQKIYSINQSWEPKYLRPRKEKAKHGRRINSTSSR